jgi:actin-related protein 5
VCYSVDSLLSFYYNLALKEGDLFSIPQTNGLIVSSSYQATHIIPILDGNIHLDTTKRLALGGSHHFELLNKSLTLKYAQHKNNLSQDAVQYIMENHTHCAQNYREQILFLESVYEEERNY